MHALGAQWRLTPSQDRLSSCGPKPGGKSEISAKRAIFCAEALRSARFAQVPHVEALRFAHFARVPRVEALRFVHFAQVPRAEVLRFAPFAELPHFWESLPVRRSPLVVATDRRRPAKPRRLRYSSKFPYGSAGVAGACGLEAGVGTPVGFGADKPLAGTACAGVAT